MVEKQGYGPNWPAQRKAALERDGYTCQYCGKVGKLVGKGKRKRWTVHVHHRRKIAFFADVSAGSIDWESANDLSNLITLCQKCHKCADAHDDPKKRGWEYLR